jgi:hypothetical protein
MAEIHGTTTLENKFAIRSAGDVVATVHGRRCVVSALGFENKKIGDDPRLLAKLLAADDEATVDTPKASAETQAFIDLVDWPRWPQTEPALGATPETPRPTRG